MVGLKRAGQDQKERPRKRPDLGNEETRPDARKRGFANASKLKSNLEHARPNKVGSELQRSRGADYDAQHSRGDSKKLNSPAKAGEGETTYLNGQQGLIYCTNHFC